jgi:hypothetical protein
LVLTAHPTQALRASLLKKYARIRSELDSLHTKRLSNYEKVGNCDVGVAGCGSVNVCVCMYEGARARVNALCTSTQLPHTSDEHTIYPPTHNLLAD